jgi:hypothetical protein
VQDQPVVRIAAEGLGHDLLELRFDLVHGLAWGEARAVADAEDVGVDGKCFLAERSVEDDVGRLAADARQRLQLFPSSRHFTAVGVDQRLREGDDIPGLGVEEADGLDCLAERVLSHIDHLPGRLDAGEDRPAGNVDAGIRGLRGQNDGDEQLIGISRLQLGRRRRIRLRQPAEEFEHLFALHARSSSALPRRLRPSSKSLVGRPKPMRKWSGISNQRPGTIDVS